MGRDPADFKLRDQLLQSPPHLLLCNVTQRGYDLHSLSSRELKSLLFLANPRLSAGAAARPRGGRGGGGGGLPSTALTGSSDIRGGNFWQAHTGSCPLWMSRLREGTRNWDILPGSVTPFSETPLASFGPAEITPGLETLLSSKGFIPKPSS